MKLITNLKNYFKSSPPVYKSDYPLEFAFHCGGVDYFEFVDKNNLPYERGLEALTFYQEMQNGVTNDYIKSYNAAMNKLLSDPKKINLNEIIKLQAYFEQRCSYIISKEIVYKVASVAFVSKDEPLTRYDFKANEKRLRTGRRMREIVFFVNANKEISTVFGEIRKHFPDVFEHSGKGGTDTSGYSFITAVRDGIASRERLKITVLNYLPANYQINLLNLYDFFFFANEAKKPQPKTPKK